MPIYKNISSDDLDLLYKAVKDSIDYATGTDTPLSEIQVMVDEYRQGQIDFGDLLNDIQAQLDWIDDGRLDDINTAIAAIPGFNIPNGLKTILIGMLENQKRILEIEKRELKAWRFMIKNVRFE